VPGSGFAEGRNLPDGVRPPSAGLEALAAKHLRRPRAGLFRRGGSDSLPRATGRPSQSGPSAALDLDYGAALTSCPSSRAQIGKTFAANVGLRGNKQSARRH
jgi:hypothetical protein